MVTINNVTYALQGDLTAHVTGHTLGSLSSPTNVVIPDTITSGSHTYTVTFINSDAFKNSSNLASISIPDSIIRVLFSAFENCSQLTAVSIGNTCNTILGSAFNNCPQLSTVTIGTGLTDIGSYAFANCQSLTSMYFLGDKPGNQSLVVDNTDNVKIYYVAGTSGWSSTFINRSTEAIAAGTTGVASITAFDNTNKTASFSITDNSYTNIELLVLHGSSGVTSGTSFALSNGSWSVTSPALVDGDVVKVFLQTSSSATVTELLDYSATIVDGTTYYSVDLRVGIVSIGEAAFINCIDLTSATIGDSATSIGFYAFDNCSLLTSVTIGNSITDISIFASLTTLTSMIIRNGNTTLFNENGSVYKISGSTVAIVWCPHNVSEFIIPTSVTRASISNGNVPYTVTQIGDNVFLYSQLTSVTIGSNVTRIGYGAFYACQLNSVTIPDAVTFIDESAFYGCSNLASVTIGVGLNTIGSCAFSDCYSTLFTRMYFLGDKPQSIADDAFNGTNALVEFYYVDGAANWNSNVAGRITQTITAGTTNIASITAFDNTNQTASFSIADSNYTNVELLVLNGSSGVTSGTSFTLSNGSWTVTSPALVYGELVKVFLQTSSSAAVTELLDYIYNGITDTYSVELRIGVVPVYIENMNFSSGSLTVPPNGAIGTISGGTVTLGSGSTVSSLNGGTVNVASTGQPTINSTSGTFAANLTGGNVAIGTLDGSSGSSVVIALHHISHISDGTFAGTISGAGTLGKTSTGTLTLSGNNSDFTGFLEVTDGVVEAQHVYALGNATVNIGAGMASGGGVKPTIAFNLPFAGAAPTISNPIHAMALGLNNVVKNAALAQLTFTGGFSKNGATLEFVGYIKVASNINGPNPNSDVVLGDGSTSTANVTLAYGHTYDYNGPTTVTSGSTLTLEDGVSLLNSDVTIDAGATLVLEYATLGFTMKSLTMTSGSYLVVSGSLSANTYTMITCSATSSISSGANVSYTGSLSATVSVASNNTNVQIVVGDNTTPAPTSNPGTTPSSNVCFPAKTPVLTNQGPVNIEDINPAVHTIRNKKIVAITKTVAHDKNLVRIAKHALGHLYPEKTTFISQNHKVFFQGQMVKAKHLVDEANGVTLVPYNGEALYNVLLEEHEKMQVNNLIVETLHPEHKVAKLYRFLKNVDAAHHGKLIALFNKKDKEHRNHFHF